MKVPVNRPLLDGNEEKYLIECIRTGWISSEGPFVSRFEQEFAARVGRKFGIAVCNGTAAIDASVAAIGIAPGDEIILPSFTIISCVNEVARLGAKPVLIDSDPRTWNMDVSRIEEKITNKTKAIMIVHTYGLPVDMDPVLSLAQRYSLKIIEDAAEMHGQKYRGRPCGSFGDVSIFSFYPNKHVTTGEGGMILTDCPTIAEECRSLRNLCFQDNERFVHQRLGWNLRMTNLQAAVGVAQLERLEEFVAYKRRLGALYSELLGSVEGIQLPLASTSYAENIYWVFGVVLDEALGLTAKEVMSRMAARGVGCRPFFCPMDRQPILREMGLTGDQTCPEAGRLYDFGFYLPSGMATSEEEIVYSANALKGSLL